MVDGGFLAGIMILLNVNADVASYRNEFSFEVKYRVRNARLARAVVQAG